MYRKYKAIQFSMFARVMFEHTLQYMPVLILKKRKKKKNCGNLDNNRPYCASYVFTLAVFCEEKIG